MRFVLPALIILISLPLFAKDAAAKDSSTDNHAEAMAKARSAVGFATMAAAKHSKLVGAREKEGKSGCVVMANEWEVNKVGPEFVVTILKPGHLDEVSIFKNSFIVGGPAIGHLPYPDVKIAEETGGLKLSYSFKGSYSSGTSFDGSPQLTIAGSKVTIVDIYGAESTCDLAKD